MLPGPPQVGPRGSRGPQPGSWASRCRSQPAPHPSNSALTAVSPGQATAPPGGAGSLAKKAGLAGSSHLGSSYPHPFLWFSGRKVRITKLTQRTRR